MARLAEAVRKQHVGFCAERASRARSEANTAKPRPFERGKRGCYHWAKCDHTGEYGKRAGSLSIRSRMVKVLNTHYCYRIKNNSPAHACCRKNRTTRAPLRC